MTLPESIVADAVSSANGAATVSSANGAATVSTTNGAAQTSPEQRPESKTAKRNKG